MTLALQFHSLFKHLSSSLIVVQVHQPPCILFDFSGINKPPGELNAVSDIRRAASPLPALLLVVVALFLSVTATIAEVALAAGSCDSVCNPGSSNGIGERSFPASYSKLLSKDCFLSQRRAVPPPIPKLILALIDSHLCPFSDHNDGIRAALTDRSLPRGQAWDFVADDISS